MKMMTSGRSAKQIIVLLIFALPLTAIAQDTLRLTRQQAEGIFLKENLMLIAEGLNVPLAEALVLQASLWPNPEFSVEEVNAFVRRPHQYTTSLEQLILTAGKRKKLMAVEQVGVDKSKVYFQELLRNLKFELRQQLTDLQFLQRNNDILQNQLISVKQLTAAYQRQVQEGNIARNEYIRLKALELEIEKSINDLEKDMIRVQHELKMLMQLPYDTPFQLSTTDYAVNQNLIDELHLQRLFEQAKTARPDYRLTQLDQLYFDKLYVYEQAQRVPDLRLKAMYDRASGVYDHFFGLGVSVDLPLFNRNQGFIRQAQIARQQAGIHLQQKEKSIETEIATAFGGLIKASNFLKNIDPDYESTLDEMLAAYTRNFQSRNISMLEYLDFLEAYLDNKKILIESIHQVREEAEKLNHAAGTDVINLNEGNS